MQSKKTTNIKEALRAKAGLAIPPPAPAPVDKASIEEGRKPLGSRRDDLAALKAKATELYGGLTAIPAIDNSFRFSAQPSDEDLEPLHVEPLLDEAVNLLDQCALERSERDRLQIEKWKLQLELDQFFRTDQIHELQRQAGLDTLPYERAALDSEAEKRLEENHRNAEAQLKGLMEDLLNSGFNKRMAARELTAWISSYPLKDSELGGDSAIYTFDGARKTKPDHLFDAARLEVDEAAWERVFSLMSERYTAVAASEAGRLRKESLALLADWSQADIKFRGERAQIARDAIWEKVHQVQSPGGLLNYSERIPPVERRFLAGFRDAVARLMVVQHGIKDLYDYSAPFPKEGTAGYFDEAVLWAKNARTRTAQFDQLDQNYVLVVSLRELTKSQWEAGRAASEWTFEVPEDLFPGQAHVRLRGLGIALAGSTGDEVEPGKKAHKGTAGKPEGQTAEASSLSGFWSARVAVPPVGTVRLLSGATHEMDQKSVPVCYLGRIAEQDPGRPPEIAGANALHNASPIGKEWRVSLSPKSTGGTPTERIQDVQLHLHVAVRSQRAKA